MNAIACGVTFLLLTISCCPLATAENYQLAHKFERKRPQGGDFFGTSVVIEGSVIAIKSDSGYFDGDGVTVTHVFEQDAARGGWTEAATLRFDNGDREKGNPFLGQELAIDNGEIVIGFAAPYDQPVRHPLQFATRGDLFGWSIERDEDSLDAEDASPNGIQRFARVGTRAVGRTVDASGGFVVVDQPSAVRPDSGKGVVRVYEKGSNGWWREVANLSPPGDHDFDVNAAAIDGTTAAIVDRGLGFDPVEGLFFFERQPNGEWTPTESFPTDRNRSTCYRFVTIDNDTAITRDLMYGTVTVYERIDGVWRETMDLPRRSYSVHSASGFALEGDRIARTVGNEGDPSFSVELYRRTGPGKWELQTSIADPEPQRRRHFGASLALDQGRLLVGAATPYYNGFEGIDRDDIPSGAAFLFVPTP